MKEGSTTLDPETGEEEPLRHHFLGKRGVELLPLEARKLFKVSNKFRHLRDEEGKDVASGIYFYRLKVSGLELLKPRKMVLLR